MDERDDSPAPEAWLSLMSHRQAAQYLCRQMGDSAPSATTLGKCARPSWRRAYPALRHSGKVPRAALIPGMRRVAWSRETLDEWMETMVSRIRRRTRRGSKAAPKARAS